jgi:O-antigen/teichoic acid export membrane protein
MAKSIQRQAILSTIFTYVGFGFGAINLLLLQPFILKQDQFGLTRVITDVSLLAVSFATLGGTTVAGKFFSMYKDYLPYEKNDLPFIISIICGSGLCITLGLLFLLKVPIVHFYAPKNPFFAGYYWTIFPYVLSYMVFTFFEPYAWYAGKTVLYNMLKETVQRVLFTSLLICIVLKWIGFNGFIGVFAFSYTIPAIIMFVSVRNAKGFPWTTQISIATKRIKDKLFVFSSFYYITFLVQMCATVAGTLLLAGLIDMANAGVFAIALYFSSVIEVPSRTIVGSSVPVLQGYWRVKNFSGLSSIYKKSAMTMMIVGLGLGGLIVVNLNDIILFLEKAKAGQSFKIMFWPVLVLLFAKLVELSTGVNTYIIHTSNRWSFDLKSTIFYSIISLPLNYFLIKHFGMLGAAFAALISALFYNIYRCVFLYTQFKLQPFTTKNVELFITAMGLIVVIYFIPMIGNLYIDAIVKSILYIAAFGTLILTRQYSPEVLFLWNKWGGKLVRIIQK